MLVGVFLCSTCICDSASERAVGLAWLGPGCYDECNTYGGVSKRKVQDSSSPRPRAEHSAYDAVFDGQEELHGERPKTSNEILQRLRYIKPTRIDQSFS